MQFFDRPNRAKIALRGSSSRPPTTEQLLARAKKAREERRHRKLQHEAATNLQSHRRLALAIRAIPTHLPSFSDPAQALAALLFTHTLLPAPIHKPFCCYNVAHVRHVARSRPFLQPFVDAVSTTLEQCSNLADVISHADDSPVSPAMAVKAIVLLQAVATRHLSTPASLPSANSALTAATDLLSVLSASSIPLLTHWGVGLHLSDTLSILLSKSHDPPPALSTFTSALIALLSTQPRTSRPAAQLYRQLGACTLRVDGALPLSPWLRQLPVVKRVMTALADDDLGEGKPFCTTIFSGWREDLPDEVAEFTSGEVAVCLSNVLEIGDRFIRGKDQDALWAFIAVLSILTKNLPTDVVLMRGDGDESDDDVDMEGDAEENLALRVVMRRLGASLKNVVSEDTVRLLLSAAVAEGRGAVVRVCQLFNFLTGREKSLNMAFQNALAFWRSGRGGSREHILKALWKFCLKGDADESSAYLDVNGTPLLEEAVPILHVFASAYSYLLYIQDTEEMFAAKWPFSKDEVREIVLVLKHYLFSALYVRPKRTTARGTREPNLLRKELGLLEEVSRLLSRLYVCDSRHEFRTGDDFWLAGRGSLASDSFLQDAVEAGPGAFVEPHEETSFRGVRQFSYNVNRKSAVSGAGELLRVAPYLVPFSSRAKIFQSWIARERDFANGGQSFFPSSGRSVAVRRKYIFEDAFEELNGLGPDLKATIRVKFIDEHGIEEAGIDGGGVFKEFMYEVLKLGFSPFSYALFKAAPDGRLYPNPDAPIANENFKVQFSFLGRLLGKAVFDGVLVDIPLARFFLSKILGQFNYPTDLESLDPELYKNMKYLKNCPPEVVEDLGLNFTVANNAFGSTDEVELVRNGKNIPVNASNRIEYMHRVSNYRMNTQIKAQSEAFQKGFSEIISHQYIRLFSHEELQLLISGKTGKIDLDDLRRNTKYSGGYNEETMVIKWFWEAMSELSAEEQSKLLQFVTSSPRAPLLGFSYLVPGFCIHRSEGHVRLPTASTCMNLLKLPEYKTLDVVREKLRYALQSNAGFDLS